MHCPDLTLKINKKPLERVATFKFLGLLINEHMTWSDHIKYVKLKTSRIVGIMNKLKFTLPGKVLLTIYQSLILPLLNFQILSWGKDVNVESIFLMQKRAVRIISKSHFLAHATPLFINLKLMKVYDIYQQCLLRFLWNFKQGNLPTYHMNWKFKRHADFHSYFTRRAIEITLQQLFIIMTTLNLSYGIS